jgi:hypothetical protein
MTALLPPDYENWSAAVTNDQGGLPLQTTRQPPSLALMALAEVLAQDYWETVHQPLPGPLARVLRDIEERDAARASRCVRPL